MGTASKGGGGAGDGSVSALPEGWRAEVAVAGNRKVLEALRELVTYPFLYGRESRLLGLKVPRSPLLLPVSEFVLVRYTFG